MSYKFKKITLRQAEEFHGHLGPYLVLGILAGEFVLKKLRCKKYFDLQVKVFGAGQKPKSCFIDGLQLSTGATYGKGNISKLNGAIIKAEFINCINNKKLSLKFKDRLLRQLNEAKTHKDSELLARKLYITATTELFSTYNL